MQKPQKISWKDTNLALIGSDIDRKVKAAAAAGEAAWQGIGRKEGTKVWRIEQFQVKEWPEDQYGMFYRGDSYIVLNTYKQGDALKHDIHIWIGSESSQDEYGTAAYKMVEADEFLGGAPVQHRQVEGSECTKFANYFNVLEYLDGGVESGFRKVVATPEKPLFFRVTSITAKTVKMIQVPMAKSSMNNRDSFILYAGDDKVWCWHGENARPIEKAGSNTWAEKMCTKGTAVVLDQGDDEDAEFWSYIGDGQMGAPIPDEEELEEFTPTLYRVDGDPSKPLEKVSTGTTLKKGQCKACLDKQALDDSDVFLLDAGWEIFVWIGKGADISEKIAALGAADRLAEVEPRVKHLPVTIVKASAETTDFLYFFR
ncbi:gelosin/severin like protein [Nitzschia inconspicua]|uniref:Gelosin/severin like protein n=1 Tax=Nitzschia inconspicua TaxID=303405 RepID=A0A9K3LZ90_9STRA|nr:gelosin/severin like protein [Nitzschia inconspicua]